MIMNKITTLLSILFISGLFCSCEHPGMEYIIQEKGLNVQESTIYVDGFLAKGTPAFAGDENEPGDRLGTVSYTHLTLPVTAWGFRSSMVLAGNYSSSLLTGHPKPD